MVAILWRSSSGSAQLRGSRKSTDSSNSPRTKRVATLRTTFMSHSVYNFPEKTDESLRSGRLNGNMLSI